MEVKVLYFGMIAEIFGKSETSEWLNPGTSLFDFKEMVIAQNSRIGELSYSIAVNQAMVTDNVELNAGDEISFFPPFAGG